MRSVANSKCRACGDRDEKADIIREYNKLPQKVYTCGYDMLGKWSNGNCARD